MERETQTDSKSARDSCWTENRRRDDMDVTTEGAALRRLQLKSNNVNKLC